MNIHISFEWRDRITEVTVELAGQSRRLFEFFPEIWSDRKEEPLYYSDMAITTEDMEQAILRVRDALVLCMPYIASLPQKKEI